MKINSVNRGPPAMRLAALSICVLRLIACLALVLALATGPAIALDPDRSISQYHHKAWSRADGAPGSINGLAQTPDGFLWLASDDGLFRFDGIRFERIDRQVDLVAEGTPYALLAARNGDLWTYYPVSKRFAVYRSGRLQRLSVPRLTGTVVDLAQTPNGDIWIAGGRMGQPMLRYRNGIWAELSPGVNFSSDINMGMVVTDDGSLWVAYTNNIFRLRKGGDRFEHMISEPGGHMRLSVDPVGRVWSTGTGGSRAITEAGGRWTGSMTVARYPSDDFARRGLTMFDRDGNLWIARRKDGLERLRKPSSSGPPASAGLPAEFRASDGLSSDAAKAIFEDREGNIWVGTTLGLDRFRNAPVVSEALLKQPAAFGDILFATGDGNIYIGQRNTVYRVRPGGTPEPVLQGVNEPEAICDGPNNSVWIALEDHIVALKGIQRTRFAKPAALQAGIQGCGLDRWGRFWISAGEDGVYRRSTTGWERFRFALPREIIAGQLVKDESGDLWMNAGGGKLAYFGRNGPALLDPQPPGGLKDIRTITSTPNGLLMAGPGAVARLEKGRMLSTSAGQIRTLLLPNGVVKTLTGETWIFDRKGITRLQGADLERAFGDRRIKVAGRTFDFLDGLIDSNAVRTLQALVRGGDGRLWAATATGTVWIDPAKVAINSLAPKLAISSFEFSGRRLFDPRDLRLPAGRSNLTIGFAALSLRMPERVQVRYRLEGQDQSWINPGGRRQAYYTNLEPGNYRFRVIGANEDGVWNRRGAVLKFSIAPTFVQSIWFKLIAGAGLIALLAAAYAARLRHLTARLNGVFGIRIAERERIARELHDTLLQGFQGLLLQFKAVANSLPPDIEPRRKLDNSLRRAQQVLIEGRDRVKDLRGSIALDDLAESLAQCTTSIVAGKGVQVELTQEGESRPIHPLVQDELSRIVEEAVRNAVAHARPSSINLLIIWSAKRLRLSVRDDGDGMPSSVLVSGQRTGHFGLVGMRERAERIGGRFVVNSREGAGTEVALEVPAHVAYLGRHAPLFERLTLWIAQAWRKPE